VWHATLNAFGSSFLFLMVTGDDKGGTTRSSSGSDARTDDFGVPAGSVRVRVQQRHTDAGR
jgi:hypothetical protein